MAYGDYYVTAAKQSAITKPRKPVVPQYVSIIPKSVTSGSAGGSFLGTHSSTPVVTAPPKTAAQQQTAQTVGGGEGTSYAMPSFDVDLSGIWETAGQMADNEINPQLAEIDRLLQEAGYSAEDSQRAIDEAYPIARRSLQKSIYENMVAGEQGLAAAGTGRGGGRRELLARAGEREAVGLEGIETQKMRETGAIQRALSQYKGQLGSQKTSLIGQRGNLQATYAEQLRGNRFNEASTIANYNLQARQLADQESAYQDSLKATAGGTGSYLDLFANTGGTVYTPTLEEINALLGSNQYITGKTTLPIKKRTVNQYVSPTYVPTTYSSRGTSGGW